MNKSALLIPALLVACGGSPETPAETDETGGTEQVSPLESFYVAAAPADAVEVSQLRSLDDGAAVVVRGDVQDFVPGLAAFSLYDHALKSCDEMGEDDHCETPWDFCCVDPDLQAQGSALVEFRRDGDVITADVAGFHGIDHLTDVVIAGTLKLDDSGNAIVVADKIHVE